MEHKEKQPFYKKWWFIVIATIFVLGVFGSSNDKSKIGVMEQPSKTEKTITNVEQSEKPPEKETPKTPKITETQKQYQKVFEFNGNGVKKSEPFTITGDRFKISYDCKGDLCQAFLYKLNSNAPQLIMNNAGSVKDETIMYGKGEYYISTNLMGSFTMTVYDYK